MLITFRLTWDLLDLSLYYTFLRQWSRDKMINQWDTCQEPTELLWMGCLIGLIWIPRFKSSTSTPNINSQTFSPKEISQVMSGTIFFIGPTSATSALFAALRISGLTSLRQNDCSEPTAMNLTSMSSTSSSSVNHPIASKNAGILKVSTGKPDARARINSKLDAASNSQGRLKHAYSRKNGHIIFMSPAAVPHREKVCSIVRQVYGRSPTDDLNDLDEHNVIWVIHERYTPSCSSSWSRIYGESAIYQGSTPEVWNRYS